MAKKETLKVRGIRFSDPVWKAVKMEAKKLFKDGTPSDFMRHVVDRYFDGK